MKTAQSILLAAFFLFFLAKGLLPAFSHIGTDFANYYTASWVAIHDRAETPRLYDQTWFATKAAELGAPRGGIFQPFPPPTALLMIPLAGFSMAVAKDLWIVLNVLMLAALVVLLRQFGQRDLISTALVLFGTGWAVVNNVYLGQVYLLMLLCLALSFHFLSRGQEILAGSLAGIFIPIKYFPLCMVVLFLLEKRWRAVWASVAMTVIVTVVSVVVMGWDVHAKFLTPVFASHMDGQMANPFAISYQSWNSLLRNVFVNDQLHNPNPLVDWAEGFSIVRVLIILSLVSALIVAIRRSLVHERTIGMRAALLFTGTLLLSPASASYHMLLLALPAALIWPELRSDSGRGVLRVLAGSYFLLGLAPVPALDRLQLHGCWIFLGFPRLFLLLVMFTTLVWLATNQRRQSVLEAA